MNKEEMDTLRSERQGLTPADARRWEIDSEINALIHQEYLAEPQSDGPTDAQLAAMDWVMSDEYDKS